MSAFGPPVGGLRTIRLVLVLVAAGVVALTFCVVLLFLSNSARVGQINDERFRNVVRTCEDVNQRHDASVRRLDELLAPRLKDATRAERARIKESRAATALLIESLTPHRDCARLARGQIDTN